MVYDYERVTNVSFHQDVLHRKESALSLSTNEVEQELGSQKVQMRNIQQEPGGKQLQVHVMDDESGNTQDQIAETEKEIGNKHEEVSVKVSVSKIFTEDIVCLLSSSQT